MTRRDNGRKTEAPRASTSTKYKRTNHLSAKSVQGEGATSKRGRTAGPIVPGALVSEIVAALDTPSRTAGARVAAGIEDRLILCLVLEIAGVAYLEPLVRDVAAVKRDLPLAAQRHRSRCPSYVPERRRP